MNNTHSWWPILKRGVSTALSSSTSTQSLTRRVSASLVSLTYYQMRYPGRKLLPGVLEFPAAPSAMAAEDWTTVSLSLRPRLRPETLQGATR